jgi:lipopolysaccharide assembly outer membrane protein LptD (OstA)
MTYLNTNAEVTYQDMKIEADYIQIDWDKGMIYARGKVDSTGKDKRTCYCYARW